MPSIPSNELAGNDESAGRKVAPTKIILRGLTQREESAEVFEGDDAETVFRQVLEADVSKNHELLLIVEEGPISFLDGDTHHWETKPSPDELAAHAAAVNPPPNAFWPTHGCGLRLIYSGPDHGDAALAACLSLDSSFSIEIKRDTRHPQGTHRRWPKARAGPVTWLDSPRPEKFDWRCVGRPEEPEIHRALERLGLELGGRYDHDRCPIAGDEPSEAKACVVTLNAGVFCHRCKSKGRTRNGHSPGFVSYTDLTGGVVASAIVRLAKSRVHWAHAKFELKHVHPNIADETLYEIYERILQVTHGERDARVKMVFSSSLRVAFTQAGPVDSESFRPLKLSNDTIDALPVTLTWTPNDEKSPLKIRRPLRDLIKCGVLPNGYTPIQLSRGISLHSEPNVIPVAIPPRDGEHIALLKGSTLLTEDEAFAGLEKAFPGLDRVYLRSVLTAAICAGQGGRPTIILAVGPTGVGKEVDVAIAASLLGDEHMKPAIDDNEERWLRRTGSMTAAGHRLIVLDEILRLDRKGMNNLVRYLLMLGSQITYRKLHHDGDITVPIRSAFILTAGGVPDNFRKSPEIRRRIWLARLLSAPTDDWERTCGGDASAWRSRSKENARIGNSILTHAYQLASRFDFRFDAVAEHIGLERPDEGEIDLQVDQLQQLYCHCRNEDGKRELSAAERWRGMGWVNARGPACWAILQSLLPDQCTLGGCEDLDSVFQLCTNLRMVNWNQMLGIRTPPLIFEPRRHSGQLVIRFRDASRNQKGSYIVNESLPPIPVGNSGPPAPDGGGSGGPTPIVSSDPPGSVRADGQNQNTPNPFHSGGLHNTQNGSVRLVHPFSFEEKKKDRDSVEETPTAKTGQNQNCISPNRLERKALQTKNTWTERRTEPDRTGSDVSCSQILASAGFPSSRVVVKVETFFSHKFNVGRLGTPCYVHDPKFHVHGVAVRWPDGQIQFRTDVDVCLSELQQQFGDDLERVAVVGHNWHFDGYILATKYDCRPRFTVDTLSLARHVHPDSKHTLRELAIKYGLSPKGNLDGLRGVRNPNPQQAAFLASYARHDAELTHQLFEVLLSRVSRPELELRIACQTARLFTERGLHIDTDQAALLHAEFEQTLQTKLDEAGIDRKTAGGDKFLGILADVLEKDDRQLEMKPGRRGSIPALAKTDKQMVALANDSNPRIRALATVRLAIKSAPQFVKRLKLFCDIAAATGGVLPVELKYYGAHTGRFSGAGGTNLQNLAKRREGPAKRIRGILRPGPGNKFVIVDLGQIEARVLAWLAGQADLVAAFKDGVDIYCVSASEAFGETVRKPTNADPPDVRSRLSLLRHIGKQAILGLGYQMGSDKFQSQLEQQDEISKLFQTGQLNGEVIGSIVRAYRGKYQQIPRLWREAQGAFGSAFQAGEARFSMCVVTRVSSDLMVELPSARRLCYAGVEMVEQGKLKYAGRKKLYGGLIVENVVQAIARDILVEAILRLEEQGLPVVLHVHDEVVVEVPNDQADSVLNTTISILEQPPCWAESLPLKAEGRVADSYGE